MSSTTRNPNRPQGGMMRGPGAMMGAGMPAEKSLNFWPSAKRLLARLQPERLPVIAVIVLTALSVTFSVIGVPRWRYKSFSLSASFAAATTISYLDRIPSGSFLPGLRTSVIQILLGLRHAQR